MEDHDLALSKAKIQLMARPDSAFFTTLVFSLKHKWDITIPTACTNGNTIWYSPDFFMKLNQHERIFLIIHEAMHCAYLHMLRRGDRDHKRWNMAADHVINLSLIERGFSMPEGGLADKQYTGLCVEEIYPLLPEQEVREFKLEDLIECDQPEDIISEEIKDILVRAAIQSRMNEDKAGTIPGDIQIFLDRLLAPKLPWQRITQKYLQSFAKNDYTFRKPNRRFFPKYYLPSLHSTSLIDLAIAVDASGSVSDEDFNVFVSEIHSMFRMMKPKCITLLHFDTKIKAVNKIQSINDLKNTQFSGRGGTCIGPVLEWANENKPQLLMIFTDGAFNFYEYTTKVDTLWLIHNNEAFTAPFGKVIHYEV